MNKDEALKMAIEFIDEITNAAGKYPYVDKTSLVADSYAMSSKLKEALEQPTMTYEDGFAHGYEAHRVEQALEKPAQEPIAWMSEGGVFTRTKEHAESWSNHGGKVTPVYTHPAPSWQGLSDNEKLAIIRKWKDAHTMREQELIGLGDAIEQALKEKNNAL